MTIAEIINVGTEVVTGQIVNTNAAHIAKVLIGKGIRVAFVTAVADDKDLLKDALKIAKGRANLIITTGGLGPTTNDIVRETVSDFLGVSLVSVEKSFAFSQKKPKARYPDVFGREEKQKLIPGGACALYNNHGTAMGFVFQYEGGGIVCLPGVPDEMQPMLEKYLEAHAVEEKGIFARNLHTFGLSERLVEEKVRHCIGEDSPVQTMTLVHYGIVTIHLIVTGMEVEAVKILDRIESDIRRELGDVVFGVGDMGLEHAVAELLKACNKTIALAESCTGGLISDKLTDIPGISAFFLEGVVSYSNEAKVNVLGVPVYLIRKHGAVSQQVARSMAEGIKRISSADIGVGITGIAGPTGGTKEKPVGLVYIAVIVDDYVAVREYRFKGSRTMIKNISANTALNMVRIGLINCCREIK